MHIVKGMVDVLGVDNPTTVLSDFMLVKWFNLMTCEKGPSIRKFEKKNSIIHKHLAKAKQS